MKISAQVGSQVLEVEIGRRDGHYVVEVDGTVHVVDAHKLEDDFYTILTGGRSYEVSVESVGNGYQVRHGATSRTVLFADPGRDAREGFGVADGPQEVVSAMPGKVVRVLVEEGQQVEEGQGVVVVEAMKMENEIGALKAGRISSISVEPDQNVEAGAVLLVIE